MAPISDIERQAFTDIYKTYSGKLYGVCLHYVNDRETAEDLLHDSFIVIFSNLGSLRDSSRLEAWMRSIVRNIACQYLKKAPRMTETSIEEIPEPVMEENTVHYTEIPLNDLLEAVDSLPEQYGNVFKLSVLEGLTHKEIGAILGIAPHSSSSNLTRAKQMLRKVISKNWGILLTFCLCIVAMLFTLKPDTTENFTADSNEIQLIPAERSEIFIAEVRKAEALKPIVPRMTASEQAEIKDEIPAEAQTETTPEKSNVFPEDTVVKKYDRPSQYEHNDIFDEPAERTRRTGKLKFSLDGNFGRSADGRIQTLFPTSNPGQPGDSGKYPSTGDSFTSSWMPGGELDPPDNGAQNPPYEGFTPDMDNNKVLKYRHAIPLSLNASATLSFTDRWMITTGIRYTYLHSDITNLRDLRQYCQEIHYIGIPVKVSWTFWRSSRLNSYISAGTTIEFPISGSVAGKPLDVPYQWSAGMGIGLQYDITPHIGIYIEPEMSRYFDNKGNVETIRSERPLTLTLPIGIRFSL